MSVTMGHHTVNNTFFERGPASITRSGITIGSVGRQEKRQPNQMDHVINSPNTASSLREDFTVINHSLENSWTSTKRSSLVFNIGPTFFHLLSINLNTRHCFNYLLDFMNGLGSVNNKFDSVALNDRLEINHEDPPSFSISNGKRRSLIKLNVFSDKCICEKCLLASYFFYGNQPTELRYEFLRVLSSEHCRTWDVNWIIILIEQSNIFFCCIKDGLICERLLEPASLCAKMLLIKKHMKHLLEFKYSYMFFHMNFLNTVGLLKCTGSERGNIMNASRNCLQYIPFYGTGKEEREVVDGVRVVSFKTEADMNEYTNLELRYINKNKSLSFVNCKDDIAGLNDFEIVPNKTNDITKIKGWRNKFFSFELPSRPIYDEIKKHIHVNNEMKKPEKLTGKSFFKHDENVTANSFEFNEKNQMKVVKEIHENIEKVTELDLRYSIKSYTLPTEKNDENLEKRVEKFETLPEGYPWLITENKAQKDKNGLENSFKGICKPPQAKPDRTNTSSGLPIQDPKLSEDGRKVKGSIFESNALDEFLKNNKKLNIHWDVPALQAVDLLSNFKKLGKQNEIFSSEINFMKLDCEVKKETEVLPMQDILMEPTVENATENKNSVKIKSGFRRQINNSTLRYIWVQGRPIEVVNEEKEDEGFRSFENKRSLSPIKTCFKKFKQFHATIDDALDNQTRIHLEDKLEENNLVHSKKPRLLSGLTDEEVDIIPPKIDFPNCFGPTFIPVVHGCTLMNGGTNRSNCCCTKFSLCMVLTIAKGRPLFKEAVENLEELSLKDNSISERMATIAACAFTTGGSRKIRRVIVPVVSNTIINSVKNWEEKLAYEQIALSVPFPSSGCDIDREVREIVNDIVDYTVRKLDPIQISYDPTYNPCELTNELKNEIPVRNKSGVDSELHKINNVSVIDKKQEIENNCGNDFCIKGCVCISLNNKINFPLHCGKISCLFECTCPNRQLYELNVLKADSGDTFLAKEERQSTISNSNIEIKSSLDKMKREKKLPTRYRNNVLLGKEMCSPTVPSVPCYKVPVSSAELQMFFEEGKNVSKGESQKKQTMKRRLGFCAGIIKGKQSLADVFIWCGIHDRYNCLCVSWIGRLNQNAFIWKPERNIRYLPHKLMTEMELSQDFSFELFLYDTRRFSARTYGAPIEYAVRNRSEIFLAKRKCELENGIISCTNSYIKMKFFMVKDREIKEENQSKIEAERKQIFKFSTGENIYIEPLSSYYEELEEIEISDNSAPMPVEHIEIVPDSESENDIEDSCDEEMVESKLTLKFDSIKKELKVHKELGKKKARKEIKMPESPSKTFLKSRDPINTKINKSLDQQAGLCLEVKPENIFSSTNVETDEKKGRQQNDDFILSQLIQNAHEPEKSVSKKKKVISLSQNVAKESDLRFKYKIDTILENSLIRLEDHPLKDQMYGSDNLPKLALLCLTPEVGYLPIIEFNSQILAVQDPVFSEIFHSFKNLESANLWLNRFFKNRLIFETIDTALKWVVVKPGVLRLKRSSLFCPSLLDNPYLIVTNAGLIFKKKDIHAGGVYRRAVVSPKSLSGEVTDQVAIREQADKRKVIYVPSETIVDICDGDGKRRKIQLETLPVSRESLVKHPINLLRNCSSLKVQESLNSIPVVAASNSSRLFVTANNIGSTSSVLRVNVGSERKEFSTHHYITPSKTSINSFIVSGSTRTPLRYQINPTGKTTFTLKNNSPARSLSPPPLMLRDSTSSSLGGNSRLQVSRVPLTGSNIVSRDGRHIIIRSNATFPINMKER